MTAEGQLDYVERYFQCYTGRLNNLGDVYLAVLYPAGIGKSDDYVMFSEGGSRPTQYFQNKGLDLNKDGNITRGEVCSRIYADYDLGMTPPNVWSE